MLAATTGMRIGEILGLKGSCLRGESYLEVSRQYTAFQREINGEGYLFSPDGGVTPISRSAVCRHFQSALAGIGIDRDEQLRRNLTFHKWRRFFNTTLRMGNVADSKVRDLTGRKSEAMTEPYTHFDPREFAEVRRIQEGIVRSEQDELSGDGGDGGAARA